MLKLVIIGGGNVAQHLAQAFAKAKDVSLLQVFTRTPATKGSFPAGVTIVHDYADLCPADLYVVAVSDNAIGEVYAGLPFTGRLVAHTSGMTSLDLPGQNYNAVFYPLQTFTKGRTVDFLQVPVCIETVDPGNLAVLEHAAKAISEHIHYINYEQRRALHVAAVMVNNFVNHLYVLGGRICSENGLPFDILKPLIAETAAKVQELDPFKAQTGPARRNDTKTIESHLAFLQDAELKQMYSQLTQSIQNHVKEL